MGRARQKVECYRSCSRFKLAFLFCGICFQLGQLPDLDKHRSFHIQGRGQEQIPRVRKRQDHHFQRKYEFMPDYPATSLEFVSVTW